MLTHTVTNSDRHLRHSARVAVYPFVSLRPRTRTKAERARAQAR